MTQILICQSQRGIVLATDSRAVAYGPEGDARYLQIRKLFRLAPHVMLVTAGAGLGIALSRSLQSYVTGKSLFDVETIANRSLPFLRSEWQKLHHQRDFASPERDLHRVYFIIAGYSPGSGDNPYRFVLLGSEEQGDPLHTIGTGPVVSIPRHLSIEQRLSRLAASAAPMTEVGQACEKFLVRLAGEDDEVGPPFHIVAITEKGIQVRSTGEVPG